MIAPQKIKFLARLPIGRRFFLTASSCDPIQDAWFLRQAVVFPDSNNFPSSSPQPSRLPLVASVVLGELREPIVGVGFGESGMLRTTVPKTSIDKYGDLRRGKYDIDRDTFDASVKPKS
jgi:hypothetical protein